MGLGILDVFWGPWKPEGMKTTDTAWKQTLILGLLAINFFPNATRAATETKGDFIHNDFAIPRSLGAGNTFSGIDDYAAILANPAEMAWMQEAQLNMGIQAGGTPSLVGLVNDISNASSASTNKEQKMADLLVANYGKSYGVRATPLSLIWSRKRWGIAVIPADLSGYFNVHRKVGPQLVADLFNDTNIVMGWAKKFGDYFSAGFSGRLVYRAYMGQDILALNLVNDPNFLKLSDVREGLTVDTDLGMVYAPPVEKEGFFGFLQWFKPRFSAVVRNALDVGFFSNLRAYGQNTGSQPPNLERRLDIGSRWDLPEFWFFRPRWMLDIRNIGHSKFSFLKGLHSGVELQGSPWTWLKGSLLLGVSQGYWTAGWIGQLAWFRMDIVTYGEEMGLSGARAENRNYLARASLDF